MPNEMARIRTLKPELWLSPQVMNLSHPARLLFIGLITQADDDGRGIADARRLKAAIFPGDDVTVAQVTDWLAEVETQELARVYDGGSHHGRLFDLPSWGEHQKVDHPRGSRYPSFANVRESVANPREPVENVRGGSTRARGSDLIGSEGSEGSLTRTRARAREAPRAENGGKTATEAWLGSDNETKKRA